MTTAPPPPQRDWVHTNPNIRRHLAGHAAAGDVLPELLRDTRFWLYTDNDRLTRTLTTPGIPDAPTTRLLRRALDPVQRATILHAFALPDEPQAL
ncbi:hypothetical protein [Nocardia abscessus]|uniref:hypothetical protein n=1 Tax=Nocardia abscessus TaxID=120957 RepID=UPI00245905B7|nr:hypothetical protein [Nocardia abscessus]